METNLSQMSLTELKALAYDQIAQGEMLQKNLQAINAEIMKKSQPQKEVPTEAIEPEVV